MNYVIKKFLCLCVLVFLSAVQNPAHADFKDGCWIDNGNQFCSWGGDNFYIYPANGSPCCGYTSDDNPPQPIRTCSWDDTCKHIEHDACGCTSSWENCSHQCAAGSHMRKPPLPKGR